MHRQKFLLAAVLLIASHCAFADMFNVQLSDKSGRFNYAMEMFGGQYGPVDLDMGIYINQDDDKMAHIGLVVHNDTLDSPLVISIGTRLYYGDIGNEPPGPHSKFSAIAIGGELLFIPDNLGGLGLGVHYYVAPSVVSYIDADGFTEYGIRLDYEITRQANIFVGYQKIKVDLVGGPTLDVDSSTFFGIGMRF
jgi:hypothetical protein